MKFYFFYHPVNCLVDMESRHCNHNKLVFECFFFITHHFQFRTFLTSHRLFQNQTKPNSVY